MVRHNQLGNNNSSRPKSDPPVFRSVSMLEGRHTNPILEGRHGNLIGLGRDGEVAAGPGRPMAQVPPEKFASVAPSAWNQPQLTTVGLYYPLGPCQIRMKVELLGGILLSLQDVFRKLSLHAKYNDSPIAVYCRSLEQVELEVCIFGSRTNAGEIVVEIERKDGDAIAYHNYASQVARVLSELSLGNEPTIRSEHTSAVSPCCRERNALELLRGMGEPGLEDILGALETTWGMINADRLDAKRLGFESMVHMTDPSKSGFSVAKVTVDCLLFPKGGVQERVSRGIFEYATRKNATRKMSGDVFHSDPTVPFWGGPDEDEFSYLALIVITQAFQVAAEVESVELESFFTACPADFIEALLAKVHSVHENPHQAYYAVQSLTALCTSVPALRSRINNQDVEEAQLFGNSCHFALATATHNLLLSLKA